MFCRTPNVFFGAPTDAPIAPVGMMDLHTPPATPPTKRTTQMEDDNWYALDFFLESFGANVIPRWWWYFLVLRACTGWCGCWMMLWTHNPNFVGRSIEISIGARPTCYGMFLVTLSVHCIVLK